MLEEFKKFALRGNVVDLAVGIIIGAAFGKIVDSLVKDIIMPIVGAIFGGLDFSNKFLVLRAAKDGSVLFNTPADAAKAGAIEGCKTKTPASETSKALCRIVATFKNQCAALAFDPKDGTPGFGWGVADTAAEAKELALDLCRATAGPDRRDACIIAPNGLRCDGQAK